MAKSRVTKEEFKDIKRAIVGEKFRGKGDNSYRIVARRFNRSLPTVMRIHATKNHEAYVELVRAEHPPRKRNSLSERFNTAMAFLLNKEILEQAEYDVVTKGRRYEPDTD